MYIHVIFNPNQVKKPQGNKVVQYFKILNSVHDVLLKMIMILSELRIAQLCPQNERTLTNALFIFCFFI